MTDERWYEPGKAPETKWEVAALRFVEALMRRDWNEAHCLVAAEARSALSPMELERRALRLVHEEFGKMGPLYVLSSIEQWPDKRPNDQGIAYVQIGGDGNEAITPTIVSEGGSFRVRAVDWGRP